MRAAGPQCEGFPKLEENRILDRSSAAAVATFTVTKAARVWMLNLPLFFGVIHVRIAASKNPPPDPLVHEHFVIMCLPCPAVLVMGL